MTDGNIHLVDHAFSVIRTFDKIFDNDNLLFDLIIFIFFASIISIIGIIISSKLDKMNGIER